MYEKKIGNSSAEAIGRIPQTKNDIFPDRNLVDREVGVVAAMKMKTSVTNQWVAKQLSLVNVLKISCMANVSIKESDPEFIEKLNATTNHKPRPLFSLMDAENRLIVMETHPAVAEKRRLEFAYDSQGRRIRKEVQDWEPGSGQFIPAKSLRFFYDGWNLIEERDFLNGDAVKRRHVWGVDVTGTPQGAGGVGGLLWSETATHTFAASADANGNILAWIETATLSVSGRADYGAFGEPVVRIGAAREMPFGFSTKYMDFETDLLYYGFRYYSSNMGRFLNRDPLEEDGGLNLYAFVGNDPVNRWDYLGLKFDWQPWVGTSLSLNIPLPPPWPILTVTGTGSELDPGCCFDATISGELSWGFNPNRHPVLSSASRVLRTRVTVEVGFGVSWSGRVCNWELEGGSNVLEIFVFGQGSFGAGGR